jgi:hypothetical protein
MTVAYANAIPEYPSRIKGGTISWEILPARGQYADVLPYPADKPYVLQALDVVADDREILRFPALAKLDSFRARGVSVLRFTGEGLLMHGEVILSCGDAGLDRQALNILKASGVSAGKYTVNWRQNGGGK